MNFGESRSQREARMERARSRYPELRSADVPTVLAIDRLRRQEGRTPTSFGLAIEETYIRHSPPSPTPPQPSGGGLLNRALNAGRVAFDTVSAPARAAGGLAGDVAGVVGDRIGNAGRAAYESVVEPAVTNYQRPASAAAGGLAGESPAASARGAVSGYRNVDLEKFRDVGFVRNLPDEDLWGQQRFLPDNVSPRDIGAFGAGMIFDPLNAAVPGSGRAVNATRRGVRGAVNATRDLPVGLGIKDVGEEAAEAAGRALTTPEAAVELAPIDRLMQSIKGAKPLQKQNQELLHQFRQRQSGGFANAVGSGESGFNRGLSAMRGTAERVTFEPLRNALDQPAIDTLFDRLGRAGLRPFEQANAGAALRGLLDGNVPVPSELAQLERAMPGVTEALRKAKIVSGPSLWEEIKGFAGLPQSIMSSLDLSGFRQTATAAYGHPKMAASAFKQSLRAARSEDNFRAIMDDLDGRWYAGLRADAGVAIADGEVMLSKGEGTLASKIVNNFLPGYRASQRAYSTMLNLMRDGLFQRMLDGYGAPVSEIGADALQRWGRAINVSTGRGYLPAGFADTKVGGSPIFWAPRLIASRVEMPIELGRALKAGDKQLTTELARQVVAFVGVNTALLTAGAKAGLWEVNLDPRSADFGQARIGNQRIDPWAGYRPLVNLVARMATGERTSTTTGDTSEVERKQIVADFLRQKFSPLTGVATNLFSGENQIGTAYGIGDAPGDLLVPLFIQNLYEAIKNGGLSALPGAALGGLGLGVNTYERPVEQVGYENLEGVAQQEAIPAYAWSVMKEQEFFAKTVEGYGSYSAWYRATVQDLANQMKDAGMPAPAAIDEAEKAVGSHPVVKAYVELRNMLEEQWTAKNPEKRSKQWEEEMKRPASERRNLPRKAEQEAIFEGLARPTATVGGTR